MGCAPMRGMRITHKADSVLVEEFVPPRSLPYHISSGIPTRSSSHHTIIFVFGGPGSQKGLATHELITQYEFNTITVEEIVLSYLPNKVANTVSTTSDIQDLLRKDTGVLSLDWIFSMIAARLSQSMHQRFIIDIVPALSSLLRADSFTSDEHTRCLENFERQHPIMFALDLTVASLPPSDKKENAKPGEDKQNLSKEMSAFLKGIDEADKGRLEKRLDAYNKCAAPFLAYFQQTHRLVKLDVSSMPSIESLGSTVHEIMRELRFSKSRSYKRIILFASDASELECIDGSFYNMKKMRMSDIVRGVADNTNMASQIVAIKNYIERVALPRENFAIVLDNLNSAEDLKTKKINFVEKKLSFLDEYITAPKAGKPTIRQKLWLHAVDVSNEETLLFIEPFPVRLATKVGLIWGDRPSSRLTVTPSPTTEKANGML